MQWLSAWGLAGQEAPYPQCLGTLVVDADLCTVLQLQSQEGEMCITLPHRPPPIFLPYEPYCGSVRKGKAGQPGG